MTAYKTLDEWFNSFSEMPERSFWTDGSMYVYSSPNVVDADNPSQTVSGDLYLDLPKGLDPHHCTKQQAMKAAIEISIVTHLHEIAEWLKVDGERVFVPHYDNKTEWDVLVDIATKATTAMLNKHPRKGKND